MCVCVCKLRVCVSVYVCKHVLECVYVCKCACMCVCVSVYVCERVCICVYVDACANWALCEPPISGTAGGLTILFLLPSSHLMHRLPRPSSQAPVRAKVRCRRAPLQSHETSGGGSKAPRLSGVGGLLDAVTGARRWSPHLSVTSPVYLPLSVTFSLLPPPATWPWMCLGQTRPAAASGPLHLLCSLPVMLLSDDPMSGSHTFFRTFSNIATLSEAFHGHPIRWHPSPLTFHLPSRLHCPLSDVLNILPMHPPHQSVSSSWDSASLFTVLFPGLWPGPDTRLVLSDHWWHVSSQATGVLGQLAEVWTPGDHS